MAGPLGSVRPEKPTVVDLTVTWRDHETETFKGVIARPEGAWLVVTFPPGTEGSDVARRHDPRSHRAGRRFPLQRTESPVSADLLRRAATLLRHTAGAAQIGPWFADSWEIYSQTIGGPWVGETLHIEDEGQSIANGAYIALMHPPVALALAVWLDAQGYIAGQGYTVSAECVAVARAVLREPEGGDRDA